MTQKVFVVNWPSEIVEDASQRLEAHGSSYHDMLPRSDRYFHPDGRGMAAPFSLVTGHVIDLAEPDFSRLDIPDLMRALATGLSNTCRYGGQLEHRYSVAQHLLLGTTVLEHQFDELALGDLQPLLHELVGSNVGPDATDRALALLRLHFLLHDAPEGVGLGDVVAPLKRLIAPLYGPLEHRMEAAIYLRLGLELPGPLAAALVRAADLQMLHEEMWHLRGREDHRELARHPWEDAGLDFEEDPSDSVALDWITAMARAYEAATGLKLLE